MNFRIKSERIWILTIGACSLIITLILLLEFQNYNLAVGTQNAEILWFLWIFTSLFGLVGGIVYFLRIIYYVGFKVLYNRLAIFFLILSTIGFFQMGRIVSRFHLYVLPTSEKGSDGYTIYPPLGFTGEQLEHVVFIQKQAPILYGLGLFSLVLLVITLFVCGRTNYRIIK